MANILSRYCDPILSSDWQIQRVTRVLEQHRRLGAKQGVTLDQHIQSLTTLLEEVTGILTDK